MVFIAALPNASWMSPVTSEERLVVSANDESINSLLCEPGASVVHSSPLLYVLTCQHPSTHALWRKARSGWTRMFERTYVAPVASDAERSRLIAAFFDWLGGRYCEEIEPSRNRACYEFLFDLAQQSRDGVACAALLDIGCGPGTILRTRLPTLVPRVLGYDIGSEVRRAAHVAGLAVMTKDEFLQGNEPVDVALSAYVMHYGCDVAETLMAVARHLKPGGAWAMNFHKSINFPQFIESLPGTGLCLATAPQRSLFGLTVTLISDATG